MRVLMTGGGTAGHVNPAIAIANTIKEYDNNACIEFVSSNLKNDKARELVPLAGYKLHGVDICGRYSIWNIKNVKTAYYILKSNIQAKKLIREFKPDVIIGTGGFACYPLLKAGADMNIPTLLHESNAIPGRAVIKLASKVDCVMVNFEAAIGSLKNVKRAVRVGNPTLIKKEYEDSVIRDEVTKVLSFGGSGGAEVFNEGMCDVIAALSIKYPSVKFLHASGKRDHARISSMFEEKGLTGKNNVELRDYIYNMDEEMQDSDIVVSRAGAMTLSELSLMGKPSILVPSPNVIYNHQYKNAKPMSDKAAALLVEEKDFKSNALINAVESLIVNKEKRAELSKNIKDFALPNANKVIYDEILKVIENKKA